MLIVLSQFWHGRLSLDSNIGVQKIHSMDAPRVGGIAIAVGLVIAYRLADSAQAALLRPLLLAAVPVFAAGLIEDLTKRVGPMPRLLAAMFSGALACGLSGLSMQDTGIPALDWALQWTPLAVMFTAFAVGGMTNAINIVDGFNGMAAGICIIILLSFSAIANGLNDAPLMMLCLSMACIALGFAVVNWPSGSLFLGDGGAYLLGLCVAWMAVLLVMRHSEVNGWAAVMVCAYLMLAEHLYTHGQAYAEGWNFGPKDDDSQSVQWIVEHMVNCWGKGASWQQDGAGHPHEASQTQNPQSTFFSGALGKLVSATGGSLGVVMVSEG